MTLEELRHYMLAHAAGLCVGLDADPARFPFGLSRDADGMFMFNCAIVNATRKHAVAYKLNTAFYEAMGPQGWRVMERTIDYIGPGHFIIADAKRGDIGNTARQYARAFFERTACDAITLSPYMGMETVSPFLEYPDKTVILLGPTSNPGARALQDQRLENGMPVFLSWMAHFSEAMGHDRLMWVVGGTHPELLQQCRDAFPNHLFLVPGLGAQGGVLHEALAGGWRANAPLLINVSRDIIFADASSRKWEEAAAKAAAQWAVAIRSGVSNLG